MPAELRTHAVRRWRAMGSTAEVVVLGGGDALLDLATGRVAALETRWSRFRDDAELTELSHVADRWVTVSAETARLIELMLEGWRATDGRFDPTVLPALQSWGYAEPVGGWPSAGEPPRRTVATGTSLPARGLADVAVDGRRVRLGGGVALDAGACGKGLAADLVAEELIDAGASGVLVGIGGDVRVAGEPPDPRGWGVAVEGPDGPIGTLALTGGGVATSSTRRRRWEIADGRSVHHVIDPRTGAPSTSDVVQATVLAASAGWAEVVATAAVVGGSADLEGRYDTSPALLVTADGGQILRGGFERWLR